MITYIVLLLFGFGMQIHCSSNQICPPTPRLKGQKGDLQALAAIDSREKQKSNIQTDDCNATTLYYPCLAQGVYCGYSILGGNVDHIKKQGKTIEQLKDAQRELHKEVDFLEQRVLESEERIQRHKERGLQLAADQSTQLKEFRKLLTGQAKTISQNAEIANKNVKRIDENESKIVAAIHQLDSSTKQQSQLLQELKSVQAQHARSLADPKIFVGKKSKTGKQVASFQESLKKEIAQYKQETDKKIEIQQAQITQLQNQLAQSNSGMKRCMYGGFCVGVLLTSWLAYLQKNQS